MSRFMLAVVVWVLLANAAGATDFRSFDTSTYSQAVTECDRQAAHPDDPHKVIRGLESSEMDMPAAIAACEAALKADPDNPRIVYQLARALTYAGRVKEGLPLIERAASMDYPQALFVTGYLYLSGAYDAPKDACRAAELIRRSAILGRVAGQVGFPAYFLEGRFAGCPVKQDPAEMVSMLEAARTTKLDYYAGLLVSTLLRQLRAADTPTND
jgi:TPR repeat protein